MFWKAMRALANVTMPLTLGLSPGRFASKSQYAPLPRRFLWIAQSTTAHMMHIIARRTRLSKLQAKKVRQSALGERRAAEARRDAHHGVHLPLDPATLARRSSRVEHDLGVATGHDDDSDDPVGVADDGSSQEDGVEVDGASQRLAILVETTVLEDDGGVVLEHVDVGGFGFDDELGVSGDVGRGSEVGEFGDGVAGLEVRLSVEVLRLDVADVLLLGRGADDEICGERASVKASQESRKEGLTGWNALVSSEPHKVADLEILPGLLDPLRLRFVVVREVREMGLVHELPRLLRSVERSDVVLVRVVVAVLSLLRLGDLGRAEGRLAVLLLLLLLLLLPSLLDDTSSRRVEQRFGLVTAAETLRRVLLAEERRSTDLALAPEALLALGAFLLGLGSLLDKGPLEEEGGDEGGEAEGAALGAAEVGVAEGAAESEDLRACGSALESTRGCTESSPGYR